MNKLFVVGLSLAMMASQASANYVSPLKFKSLSCAEMALEFEYLIVKRGEALSSRSAFDQSGTIEGRFEFQRLNQLVGDMDMEVAALETAMDRANCGEPEKP